jgi:hypothetical protein
LPAHARPALPLFLSGNPFFLNRVTSTIAILFVSLGFGLWPASLSGVTQLTKEKNKEVMK